MHRRYHALQKACLGVALLGVAAWWWRRRPFRVAVEGRSMEPTLRRGEFLVAVRGGSIGRGDLVVVEHPDRPGLEMVKRVSSIPGDGVGDRILGPGQYWVVGDRPEASTDSRAFGPIDESSIVGVVRLRYWPLSRWGRLS